MTERRDKLTTADMLTAKTTAERLLAIDALGLKNFNTKSGKDKTEVLVYMETNKVPYKVIKLTGPHNQWVCIRPFANGGGEEIEFDPRKLSLTKPAKVMKRDRGRHD